MKKIFLFFIMLLVVLFVSATNYTVGTGGTYTTIPQVNSAWSSGTFAPGDSILFKRGETFLGNLRITESGTVAGNIIVGAWGPTNLPKPIITGLKEVTGWTDKGGNIWESSVTVCKSTLNLITFDDKIAQIGRYPNAGTMLSYESFSTTVSITDNQLTGTPNWTGAEVYIRNNGYGGQRRSITNHTNTVITYAAGNNYDMKAGYGYFIQNDVRTLDADKEWYFNKTTKKISMYFADNNPALHTIKASIYDTIVLSTDRNYITFTNLKIEGGNEANLDMNGTSIGCRVINCDMNYSGTYGVYLGTTSNFIFSGNTITNSLTKGLVSQVPNASSVFEYNAIRKSGLLMGMNRLYYPYTGFEISSGGNGAIIRYNTIDSSGYHGIFPRGTNNIIQYNFITNFGLVLDDCGGIYMPTVQAGNKILNNIILYGIGNTLGTNYTTSHAEGIYLDEISANTYLEGNTIAHCGSSGIRYHNAYSITARGNTMYDNAYNIHIIKSSSDAAHSRNLTFRQNIMVAKTSTQLAFRIYNYVADNPLLFGTADSNYYCRPTVEGSTIQTRNVGSIVNYSLGTWKTATSGDVHSSVSPIALTSVNDILFEYNASISNKIVHFASSRYYSVNNVSYTDSIVLTPYTSVVLLKDNTYNPSTEVLATVYLDIPYTISSRDISIYASTTWDGGGTISERGIVWGTSANPTILNFKQANGNGVSVYFNHIYFLTPNTTYYMRAYAINEAGTAYSNEVVFKTALKSYVNSSGTIVVYKGKVIKY